VIEFGPPNATIHKSNESIPVDCLKPLSAVFRRTLQSLLV
jgi:succinyl-diaminopimelate desuccinylase